MTENRNTPDDEMLDQLLTRMGREEPGPSAALMSAVLEDAYAAQPAAEPLHVAPAPDVGVTPVASVLAVLGGWFGLGGLALAASLGFVIGLSPPDLLQTPLEMVFGAESEEASTVTAFGWDIEEG